MQKEIKRFTLIGLAVGLVCVLLAGSALAFNVSGRVFYSNPVSVFSLNDQNDSRSFYTSSFITVGLNSSSTSGVSAGSSIAFSGSSATSVLYEHQLSGMAQRYYYLNIPAGTYVDISSNIAFSTAEYQSLFLAGGGSYQLYTVKVSSQNTVAYPDSVQFLVNGIPVGDVVSCSDGSFVFPDFEFILTSDVSTIGLRFFYTSGFTSSYRDTYSATFSRELYQVFNDNVSVTAIPNESLDYSPYLDRLISWQSSIYGNISTSNAYLECIADNLSSISGTNGIQAIVRILDPSTEGSVGNTISNIGSIYASDEDIQLKEGTKDFASAATDLMIGDSEDGSSGLLGSDSVSNVKDLKKIGNAIKSWFSFDVDIGELFTSVDSGASDWFSSDTATGIDSVGSIQSVAVDDDSDPYNMQDYYDFIDSLFAKYGGGVND